MKTISNVFTGLLAAAALALTVLSLGGTKKVSDDDRETKNLVLVQAKIDMCARSRCDACGTFSYDQNRLVRYTPTLCELNFESRELVDEQAQEDREIRAKYGAADAGTDGGN